MPSQLHEVVLELFRNSGELPRELLREQGLKIDGSTVEHAPTNLSLVAPASYYADHVTVFRDEQKRATGAVVIEVQRDIDAHKTWTWPAYLINTRARYQCPTSLLVVTPEQEVARWARKAIDTGHPQFSLEPVVISFDDVPRVEDPSIAKRVPELAVLSAMAHPSEIIAKTALEGIAALPPDQIRLYSDLILDPLPELRERLKEEMMKDYVYKTDFVREMVERHESAHRDGLRMGMLNAARTLAIDKLGELTTDEETSLGISGEVRLRELVSKLGRAPDPEQARAVLEQFRARGPF